MLATGERVRFTLPSGHVMELYAEKDKVGNGIPLINPAPWSLQREHGIGPVRLDHALLRSGRGGQAEGRGLVAIADHRNHRDSKGFQGMAERELRPKATCHVDARIEHLAAGEIAARTARLRGRAAPRAVRSPSGRRRR